MAPRATAPECGRLNSRPYPAETGRGHHGVPLPARYLEVEQSRTPGCSPTSRSTGGGRPLTSHEVVVKTVATTRTRTGLEVAAHLDTGSYPLGVSVSAARMRTLPITAHSWCGAWNYTIDPATPDPADQQAGAPDPPVARARALELLADPALTGMPRSQLDELLTQLAPARAAQSA